MEVNYKVVDIELKVTWYLINPCTINNAQGEQVNGCKVQTIG